MTVTARQPKGIPAGGQFAATAHADPSIQLQMLKESEDVFAMSPGTRVMTGNEFGTIAEPGKDKNGNVTVNLDGGGSLHLKADRLVPWEAYLDTVMPPVDHNPDPETSTIDQAQADRALRGSFVRMRNALDSTNRTGDTYYQGVAFGEAEVAAALMDADADPETIGRRRGEVLMLGLPVGADHEALHPAEIKKRTAAPLTSLRARRLAGYFTARAVEMQQHNGSIPQNDWGTQEWTKQGAMLAYSKAAVRFAEGLPHNEDSYHEERFTRLLVEGETNVNTIVGETFDEHAW
ncbi:hypothetical protein Achl_4193 (plasmid) [Pseudarthrobacter chlorophenolicus A6]|uniref:Uncharacterized protein n=1 Tax=Pseudarthrobacter chlorophenolicus (strain ATCC 700700 / DSM 12829 / CIP 107037 / JCM 12360 / KCTC 9906 / NCIMB 13794 / A6) TaxID=452863 RepID=B8HI97_PSECP|nr:hypothetical protein [Pseudarthrobacter chlorophenolicus]ACL42144.1 hypothetical protein Achl_4193 [Pseudarthrobacter chlorophenolicus A6]SDQ14010.1 hypothetical protein SAMN04489738_0251 [Pseudarthrobacter chlorophenolicus]